MKEADYETDGKTLTWTINTSDLTADITNANITHADVPADASVTIAALPGETNGLTISDVKYTPTEGLKDGNTVTVTFKISGTVDTSNTTLSVSGVTPSWNASSVTASGATYQSADKTLDFTNGLTYDATLSFTFEAAAGTNTVTFQLANAT